MFFGRENIEFPVSWEQALRDQFWGGKVPSRSDLKGMAATLAKLWTTLAKERGQKTREWDRHYSGSANFAAAYAGYYLPANAMKVPLVLEEAWLSGLPIFEEGTPLSWLDLGTGPGTAYWGAAWWAGQKGFQLDFLGLDQSGAFLGIARELAARLENRLRENPGTSRARGRARWEAVSRPAALVEKVAASSPRIVSLVNSLSEIEPDLERRRRWFGSLLDAMSASAARDGGRARWLAVIEPGSKDASRELLELREGLRTRADVRIWLPCLSARPCGALQKPGDWCHEAEACEFPEWVNDLGAEAGLRKEALLFSYLLCSVGPRQPQVEGWPGSGARVVSQIMREKGSDQCFLCTETGKVKARVLHSRATPETERFAESKRGMVFQEFELSEKGDVLKLATAFQRPR